MTLGPIDTIKRGQVWRATVEITGVSLTGATVRSAVVDSANVGHDLSATVVAGKIEVVASEAVTGALALGRAQWDVWYDDGSGELPIPQDENLILRVIEGASNV